MTDDQTLYNACRILSKRSETFSDIVDRIYSHLASRERDRGADIEANILSLLDTPHSIRQLASSLGIKHQTVSGIIRRISYLGVTRFINNKGETVYTTKSLDSITSSIPSGTVKFEGLT